MLSGPMTYIEAGGRRRKSFIFGGCPSAELGGAKHQRVMRLRGYPVAGRPTKTLIHDAPVATPRLFFRELGGYREPDGWLQACHSAEPNASVIWSLSAPLGSLGKDMGIWHVSMVLPRYGPAVTGWLITGIKT